MFEKLENRTVEHYGILYIGGNTKTEGMLSQVEMIVVE